MKKERPCATCGKVFLSKRPNNLYCTRRCFKIHDYHKQRAYLLEHQFPNWQCPECSYTIKLDFDPVKHYEKIPGHFICPMCQTLMINVADKLSTNDRPVV